MCSVGRSSTTLIAAMVLAGFAANAWSDDFSQSESTKQRRSRRANAAPIDRDVEGTRLSSPPKKRPNSRGRVRPVTHLDDDDLASGVLPEQVRGRRPVDERPPIVVDSPPWAGKEPIPNWGNALQPRRPALYTPGIDYTLVGTPGGIIQSETDPVYRSTIYDPTEIEDSEAFVFQPIDLFRPDAIAPMGVLGGHTLQSGGQVLVSYRYSRDVFRGMGDGTSSLSDAQVLADFPFTVPNYVAARHLALLEYGVTDDLTLQARLPFQQFNVDYRNFGGTTHSQRTDMDSLSLHSMYVLRRWDRQQVHFNFGVFIPNQLLLPRGTVIAPGSPDFNYWMRPGSQTWDFQPGLTYAGQNDDYTWGAQALGTIRTGLNAFGYRLGDHVNLSAWVSRRITDNWAGSVRINGSTWTNIRGVDGQLDPNLIPLNDPNRWGGQRLDFLFGLNYLFREGLLCGQRLGIEVGVPAYQNLSGPQPRAQWFLTTGFNFVY
jgi:hypothetical protein